MSTDDNRAVLKFLDEIAENNTREWMAANNDRYKYVRGVWLDRLQRLIDAMTEWEPALSHIDARSSTYRFARDTRFSPDKSPYKTFFSAAISPWGRKAVRAGYYVQVAGRRGSRHAGLWGGLWCPDPTLLRKLRHAIVDNIEEFTAIISEPEFVSLYGTEWAGEQLSTAPKGWPRCHPQIDLLRLKDYGKFHPVPPSFFARADWPEKAAEMLRPLKPLVDFLNYSIDE